MSAFLYHMREAIRLSRQETDEIARLKAEVERLTKEVAYHQMRTKELKADKQRLQDRLDDLEGDDQ